MKKKLSTLIVLTLIAFAILLIVLSEDIYDSFQHNSIQAAENKNTYASYQKMLIKVQDGFDWSLPENTKKEAYSGLIGEDDSGDVSTEFVILRWDETNPERGKYDFSQLFEKIKQISPKKVLVRLEVNSACEAPKWALKKLKVTKKKSLVFWDKSYRQLLTPYIQEFGRIFANNSQVVGVQLGIADGEYNGSCDDNDNKDGWGEFWMSPKELAEAEKDFNLTPAVFLESTKSIIDLYVKAFKGNEAKLAFTNFDPFFSWEEISEKYDKQMPLITDYALKQGVGGRDGNIESWMRYIGKAYGMTYQRHKDKTCSINMDEGFAKSLVGRYWGTENEFYGNSDYVLDYAGPIENQPYRFLISSLRALQMRRNFMTVNNSGLNNLRSSVYKIQDFLPYLKKTLGKQIHNTPDVFVLLGERYISSSSFLGVRGSDQACVKDGKVSIRSFGRWLTEESDSIPAIKVNMPESEKNWAQDIYMPSGYEYEYAGRSSTRFKFNINDELISKRCTQACNAEIKVTIKDNSKTTISVNTLEGNSTQYLSLGDNKIKTITFPVSSAFSSHHKFDFSIKSDPSNVTILMLRVNFL